VLTSVDILPTERIESQVVNNNWELFGQVPGSC
jgi:iron complex outermembrane receptor protein